MIDAARKFAGAKFAGRVGKTGVLQDEETAAGKPAVLVIIAEIFMQHLTNETVFLDEK